MPRTRFKTHLSDVYARHGRPPHLTNDQLPVMLDNRPLYAPAANTNVDQLPWKIIHSVVGLLVRACVIPSPSTESMTELRDVLSTWAARATVRDGKYNNNPDKKGQGPRNYSARLGPRVKN